MWDNVYSTNDYVYGREPNDFLRENVDYLSAGSVLCVAEGEGRNAVFLAKQGFDVTAVDSSQTGLKKAKALAAENGVNIHTVHADLADYDFGVSKWQNIVSIFCHLPSSLRQVVHARIAKSLIAGGTVLLEAYTPKQLNFKTGGPPNRDMMYDKAILESDFATLNILRLKEIERKVIEGSKHTGNASVIQLIAQRI